MIDDDSLFAVCNLLGSAIFISIVVYHLVDSKKKDL